MASIASDTAQAIVPRQDFIQVQHTIIDHVLFSAMQHGIPWIGGVLYQISGLQKGC